MRPVAEALELLAQVVGPARLDEVDDLVLARARAVVVTRFTSECRFEETKYIGRSESPWSVSVARTGAHQRRVSRA